MLISSASYLIDSDFNVIVFQLQLHTYYTIFSVCVPIIVYNFLNKNVCTS